MYLLIVHYRMFPNPDDDVSEQTITIEMATRAFNLECQALRECYDRNHPYTPEYFGSESLDQNREYIYPGGYLHVIAVSKMPGSIAPGMDDLTSSEQRLIKSQLTDILE